MVVIGCRHDAVAKRKRARQRLRLKLTTLREAGRAARIGQKD